MGKRKFLFCIGVSVLLFLVISRMLISLHKGFMNVDAAYYIDVSRHIMNGEIPFLDFLMEYTPLSFFIMCIPFWIFGTSFRVALAFLYFIQIVNAFLIFKICYHYSKSYYLSVFTAVFSLMLCMLCDGESYVLEPFVLFFGLMALLLLCKDGYVRTIIAGILCFCSFWSKQYGLGFLVVALVQVSLSSDFGKKLLKKQSFLIAGFIIGLLLFVVFHLIQGVDILSMFSLSGSDYRKEGIQGFIDAWRTLFITLPLLLVSVVLMVANFRNPPKNPLLFVAFCGIFVFMLQCYVRFYAHYLILVEPFCVLLLSGGFLAVKSMKIKKIYIYLLVLSTMIPSYFTIKSNMYLLETEDSSVQEEDAEAVKGIIPENSDNVFASSDMLPMMLLNSYNPPLMRKYGLGNGFVIDPQGVEELIQASSYCIISESRLNTSQFSPEARDYLSREFDLNSITSRDQQARYLIYKKKALE